MARVVVLVSLVAAMMATGVALASPTDEVRLPISDGPVRSPASRAESVVVERGDHLWKISARHLGRDVSDEEIAPYWLEVIEVNRPTLRSGDPDLIYPGEIVELP